MITLKQTQKAKINEIVEKFKIAKRNYINSIFEAYEKPSKHKIYAYYNIREICQKQLNSLEYYIVGYNCNTFSMICRYVGKNGETRLRYWTAYNTYDCEVTNEIL